MLTAEIQAIEYRQVRTSHKEIVLRLRPLADGEEVIATEVAESVGEPLDARALNGLTRRAKERLRAAIDTYKAGQVFLKTAEMAKVVTDVTAGLAL